MNRKIKNEPGKIEFLVYGHDSNGKGKIVSVLAEHTAEALEIAREENKDCRFNHANIK